VRGIRDFLKPVIIRGKKTYMISRMDNIILVFPAGQDDEVRVLLFIALISRFRQIAHRLDCNKTRALLSFFVEFIPCDELFASHSDCIKFCYSILQHHYFSIKVLCQTMKDLFFSQCIAIKIEFKFVHGLWLFGASRFH
jgi:hypothetical protein